VKFRGHITAVERRAELVQVTAAIATEREPVGTFLRDVVISVPWSAFAEATYRIGREVTLTLALGPHSRGGS